MARHRGGHPYQDPEDVLGPEGDEDDGTDWEQEPPPAPLWRSRVLLPGVLMLALVVGAWWTVDWLITSGPEQGPAPGAVPVATGGPAPTGPEGPSAAAVPSADAGEGGSASEVIVHVAGEVKTPGIVTLPGGARVVDAVQAAGGPTGSAHLDHVNLAAPVTDGAQILIPGPDGPPPSAPVSTGNGAQAGSPGSATVDLNSAGPAELETLPGIGPALAQRIIDHRDQVGPYGSLEDLDAVSGIGPALLSRLDGEVSW